MGCFSTGMLDDLGNSTAEGEDGRGRWALTHTRHKGKCNLNCEQLLRETACWPWESCCDKQD